MPVSVSVIDDDALKTRDTEARLYGSHLEGCEGKLFARTVNGVVTKDGLFTLIGRLLKIVGDPREAGVFFVAPGRPGIAVPVTAKLSTNAPSKIVGKGMRTAAGQGLVCRGPRVLLPRRETAQRAARDTEPVRRADHLIQGAGIT
jgi:hypothetical protein